MDDQTIVILWALFLLVSLMSWALYLGIDGALLTTTLAIIGYAIGFKHKERMR